MTDKDFGGEMNQDPRPQPTVVVIGGGYGGVNVAKALDADVDVVLVEPKDAFVRRARGCPDLSAAGNQFMACSLDAQRYREFRSTKH